MLKLFISRNELLVDSLKKIKLQIECESYMKENWNFVLKQGSAKIGNNQISSGSNTSVIGNISWKTNKHFWKVINNSSHYRIECGIIDDNGEFYGDYLSEGNTMLYLDCELQKLTIKSKCYSIPLSSFQPYIYFRNSCSVEFYHITPLEYK